MRQNNNLTSRSVAAFFAVLVLCMGTAAHAADDSPKHFEIKAKPLADALMEFGVQSGLTVVAPTTLTAGRRAEAVRGSLAPTDALGRLLKGSGLTFARAGDGTIAIEAAASNGPAQASAGASGLDKELTSEGQIADIVVTARKTTERLQDTPMSIAVITADTIERTGATTLGDLGRETPGLTIVSAAPGQNAITLRGLSGNNTVGFYLDDTPLSIGIGNAVQPTNFDMDPALFDLDRVEVLRGPQGSLYGASSFGGTVRYITNQPNLTEEHVTAKVTTSDTDGEV